MNLEEIALREVTLESCRFYGKQVKRVEESLLLHIDYARKVGCTWTEIAAALGTSHQNAIHRFGRRVTYVDQRMLDSPRKRSLEEEEGEGAS